MRQKLIPCFLAGALAFTGAIGASVLPVDTTFAAVTGDKVKIDGRVAIRGEYRNNANFGSGGTSATNSFVVQNTQLGLGYDITPDLGFYILMQDSRVWGGQSGNTTNSNGGAPTNGLGFNTVGGIHGNSFGIREGYISVKNLFNSKLNAKIGRQKLVFGNQRILGHFDWSNVGWSFDGVRLDYASSAKSSHVMGWFRAAEDDCSSPASLCGGGSTTGGNDSDFLLFYNTFKNLSKHTIEPYWIYVFDGRTNAGHTTGGVTNGGSRRISADQKRHMLGLRINGKPISMLDYTFEYVYQTGRQSNGIGGKNNINAMAVAANVGVTLPVPMKPRIAFEVDYASGSGADRGSTGGRSTFENFWPTNHLHYGYMDLMGWKNSLSFGPQFSMKPSKNGTFKVHFWWHQLADADDNWYSAGQGTTGASKVGNDEKEIGNELDIVYVHKFFGGKSTLNVGYGHFFSGDYLKKSGPTGSDGATNITDDDDQDWGYVWWITKF